ncbi:MAG: Inosine-5'-monophosphate dehydrogenase [Methanoregulaceae archaeon PtaB.Bin056]|jgi:predicted transcriptional regulator|nr:MAG: Inosine-5'-monophosphate dehydrogenase [Methanoregulaceae archaeon PtaB.Bin056]
MSDDILVKDIMSRPVTISKSALITDALDRMLDEGIDPLIVVNHNTVVGTVSRQSVAEKLGTKRNSSISPTSIHVANTVEEDFTTVYPDQDLDIVIPLLQAYKLVVVYDEDHRLVGQVTAGDILRVVRPQGSLADVMEPACTIDVDERVVHWRRRMIDDNLHRCVVTENDRVVGIVTETDVAVAMRRFREMVEDRHQDHRIRNLLVKDIMTSPVLTVDESAGIDEVVDLMLSKGISSIPVTSGGKIAGVVTRASLIKAL